MLRLLRLLSAGPKRLNGVVRQDGEAHLGALSYPGEQHPLGIGRIIATAGDVPEHCVQASDLDRIFHDATMLAKVEPIVADLDLSGTGAAGEAQAVIRAGLAQGGEQREDDRESFHDRSLVSIGGMQT